jgi:hypothetical protein
MDLADEVAAGFLIASGYVDRRIGVTGGSYGGFMTLVAISKTPDVWAAAVSIRSPAHSHRGAMTPGSHGGGFSARDTRLGAAGWGVRSKMATSRRMLAFQPLVSGVIRSQYPASTWS